MHAVAPPTNFLARPTPQMGVTLTWQPSTDPDVVGYTIYRSNAGGPWTRITGNQYERRGSAGYLFVDQVGHYGIANYMIRAIKREDRGADGTPKYYNASQGVFIYTANPTADFPMAEYANGNWKGRYGSQGAYMAGDTHTVPAGANVSVNGAMETVWANPSTDPRALQKASSSDPNARVAAAFEASRSLLVDVGFADQAAHNVTLYFLDYQSLGRSQHLEILNPKDNSVIYDAGSANFFSETGLYTTFRITGPVRFRITSDNVGQSAVLSGIFFDPAT
jgi:hypothetical protein